MSLAQITAYTDHSQEVSTKSQSSSVCAWCYNAALAHGHYMKDGKVCHAVGDLQRGSYDKIHQNVVTLTIWKTNNSSHTIKKFADNIATFMVQNTK